MISDEHWRYFCSCIPFPRAGWPGEECECELHNANLGDSFLLAARFSGTIADSDVDRAGARLERRKGEGRNESQVWTVNFEDFEVLKPNELPA